MSAVSRRAVGVVRLIHPFPAAAVVITSLLLATVARHGAPQPGLLLGVAVVVGLSQVAVGALNEYVDRRADARTQPDKPIPSGVVSPGLALGLTIASLIALVPAALAFGSTSLLLVSLGTGAGLTYDLWLKPTPLSFLCYVVAFLSLLTWIWDVTGGFGLRLLAVYPAAALLVVAAHLAQSFADIDSDRAIGRRGLAVLLGPEWSLRTIIVLYLSVAVPATAICLLAGSHLGLALVACSLAVPLPAWRLVGGGRRDRTRATAMFRMVAAGIAAQGLGVLLALTAG